MQNQGTLTKLLAGKKQHIIMLQSRVNRHVCDVINCKLNVIFNLSTGDAIMNIAVYFSLRFA